MPNRQSAKSVAETSFEEARAYFKDSLSNNGVPSDLLWVFREDVIFLYDRIYIRTPVPTENESLARACYELGQKREFGINLLGFCLLDSRLCSYIAIPQDDLDAQAMLMSKEGVKYSWRTELREAQAISNSLKWRIRAWQSSRARFSRFDNHVPSKRSLLRKHRSAVG
jgi:hypothetical protein